MSFFSPQRVSTTPVCITQQPAVRPSQDELFTEPTTTKVTRNEPICQVVGFQAYSLAEIQKFLRFQYLIVNILAKHVAEERTPKFDGRPLVNSVDTKLAIQLPTLLISDRSIAVENWGVENLGLMCDNKKEVGNMTDPEKARKAFEEQDEYEELVIIDEDGNVHPVEGTPPKGKKTTILRDPKGEYL